MTTPEFRPIPDFPGYSISRSGQVLGPKGLRKESFSPDGTQRVSLERKGRTTNRSVGKLVREIWGAA